jgi:hypothetical protein
MTSDQECAECQRLALALQDAEAHKTAARLRFDGQFTVGGAKQAASRVSETKLAYETALAELTQHRATHEPR